MRYIRPAVILRQHFLRLLRLILRPRTRLRLPQARLALLRLATPPRTTQAVLRAHRDPLRPRTTLAEGHLTALQPRSTLAVQQEQAEAPLQVGLPPTGLVAALVNQRLQAGLLLTVRHVEHLVEQANQRLQAGLQVGPLTGHLRPVSLHLVRTAATTTIGIGITAVRRLSSGMALRFRIRLGTTRLRIQQAVGLIIDLGLGQATPTV